MGQGSAFLAKINPEIDTGFGPGIQPNGPLPEIPVEKSMPEDQRIQKLIEDINSCRELIVLNSYKLLVKKEPALQQAYDTMYKKLSK
jgi:hypothetical protein